MPVRQDGPLIVGVCGSIGSELCRQVARYGPKCLVLLYELSELALYTIEILGVVRQHTSV